MIYLMYNNNYVLILLFKFNLLLLTVTMMNVNGKNVLATGHSNLFSMEM